MLTFCSIAMIKASPDFSKAASRQCPASLSAAHFRMVVRQFFLALNLPAISPSTFSHRIDFISLPSCYKRIRSKPFSPLVQRKVERHPGQPVSSSASRHAILCGSLTPQIITLRQLLRCNLRGLQRRWRPTGKPFTQTSSPETQII